MTTARERARVELTAAIKEQARKQLVAEGAHQLSLRAVARDLGMASSAVYRYFPSRDELLTALIIDAYDSLGAALEAVERRAGVVEWWCDTWAAARAWALDNRREYELIFGSPVQGYRAPQDTVAPASRVPLALLRIAEAGDPPDGEVSDELREQVLRVTELVGTSLAPGAAARVMVAWAQLFGLLSFELFGQFVGSADPAGPLFEHAARAAAAHVGLTG
ncbi:TetR/AcrR family transcriptional regulator [Actinokineospora bangkokensis]|uniref:TetR family transcriptional regulator n=1 Tax=Actinokineospora bangkokensis TaxID=1193682 RepID=A0A1Q9LSE7_9PSEU|nr:TetR/AcrR family transcriptional regulator [Actinokineospora bangkokensis]OLR94966.1 TetR family transcriptional regulator [Actinokineospora bangkokensis]